MVDKKECKNCEDCKKYQDQAFELEVDEDLQQERLNKFWQKYRWLIYTAVVLILAITAGIQLYQSWWLKVRLAESDKFEDAVIKLYGNQEADALPALTDLAENGRTGYQYLARLEKAGYAVRQGNTEQALEDFKALMDSNAPRALRNVATLSYVGHQVDTADPDTLLAQLDPLKDDPAFIGMTAELETILYLRKNQPDTAKDVLKKALAMPNLSEVVTTRLQALQQMLENN
ncbi:MAG: tetratricopeptide repeat protein [Alphaproteobacteria bacterium]|nr:tetratricopeptide repeat protein [Alphaproteobacteria bacterium]